MATTSGHDPALARFAQRVRRFLVQCLGIVAITVIIGEAASRWILDVHPLTPGDLIWEHHPRWGWRHQPGSEDIFAKLGCRQLITINSRGLREREIPYEREPGVTRVLVLGDSGVVGFEVAPEHVWTRVAEDALRKKGHAVEIVNAGVRGYGTDQSLLFLMDEGVKYQPDLVIYAWNDNDYVDNETVHRPFRKFGKGYFVLDDGGGVGLRGAPVPLFDYARSIKVDEHGSPQELAVPMTVRLRMWVRDNLVARSSFVTAVVHVVAAIPQLSSAVESAGTIGTTNETTVDKTSRPFRLAVELVREMERQSHAAGAEFRIMPDGWFGDVVSDEAGVLKLDPWDAFEANVLEGVNLIVPYDTHWNEQGHDIVGHAVATTVLEDGLLTAIGDAR